MNKSDAFFDSLQYDEQGQVLWPDDREERARYAEGLLGAKVVESLTSTAEEMLSRLDGRWPTAGSMTYDDDMKVAEVFQSMTPEQRQVVTELIRSTVQLTAYSLFLGLEHFGAGNILVSVSPISRGAAAGDPVLVEAGEWHQALLAWQERFDESK